MKASCIMCGKKISSKAKEGIVHFKKEHPTYPDRCFQQFQDTWDPTLTRLVDGYVRQYQELDIAQQDLRNAKAALQRETAIRNTLATKLNGIIMILESKQDCK